MSSTIAPACTSKPSLLAQPGARGRFARTPAFRVAAPRQVLVRAEEPKQEDLKEKAKQPVNKGGSAYIDDLPPLPQSEVSPEMKKKMRDEYLGLGGSPNKALFEAQDVGKAGSIGRLSELMRSNKQRLAGKQQ